MQFVWQIDSNDVAKVKAFPDADIEYAAPT
jgi:hypothetical protein